MTADGRLLPIVLDGSWLSEGRAAAAPKRACGHRQDRAKLPKHSRFVGLVQATGVEIKFALHRPQWTGYELVVVRIPVDIGQGTRK